MVWNDEEMAGQLNAWTNCAEWILREKKDFYGTWHLEDDVIPCRDFKKVSEEKANLKLITQGFITNCKYTGFKGETGILPVRYMPYGMQCIYIPNKYLNGFIYFVKKFVRTGIYKKRQYDCGTLYSDNVFLAYMKKYYKNAYVNVLDDCMVEHIDYLIGGRSVKNQPNVDRKAVRFDNYEEVERLKQWRDRELM